MNLCLFGTFPVFTRVSGSKGFAQLINISHQTVYTVEIELSAQRCFRLGTRNFMFYDFQVCQHDVCAGRCGERKFAGMST